MIRQILLCATLAIIIVVAASCTDRLPIVGNAEIIDIGFTTRNASNPDHRVTFRVIVLGEDTDGRSVVRTWTITADQFRSLNIGDTVKRVDFHVVLVERGLNYE